MEKKDKGSGSMTAKEYLSQLWELDRKIQQRTHQVEELKLMAMGTGAMTDGERVQTSTAGDQLSAKVSRYVDLQKKIEEMIDEYVEQKTTIIGQIQQIDDDRYENILFMRYVQGKKFTDMAAELGYTYKWLSELHIKALQEFARIFGDFLKQPDKTGHKPDKTGFKPDETGYQMC